MAQELASLKIAVATGDLKRATSELNKLEKAGRKAEKGTDKLTKSNKNLVSTLTSLPALFSAVVVSMGISKVIKYADAMTLIDSKLKLATDSTEELTIAQNELFAISQKTRTQFSSTVDLYERVARSTRDYNIEQTELLSLTETINKSMIISGGTAQSMNASIIQLGQAFSADFQAVGQELASIREQTPRLYQALLEGTNLSSKAFKKLAEEGGLSTKIILEALKSQATSVNEEFTKINKTVDQSLTQIDNSAMSLIGTIDGITGASSSLSDALTGVSSILDSLNVKMKDYATNVENVHDVHKLKTIETATRELNQLKEAYRLNIFEGVGLFESTENYNAELKTQEFLITSLIRKIERLGTAQVKASQKSLVKTNTAFDSDLTGFNEGIEFATAQNDAIYEDRKKTHEDFLDWKLKIFKKDTKEEEKASEKMWDNVGDIAKNSIAGALQAGMDGELDMSSFISQLSKSIGQAMLLSGNVAAGLGLMAVGSIIGGGDTETSAEKAEKTFNKFMEGLDKATQALEDFGNVGSSIENQISSLQSEIQVAFEAWDFQTQKLLAIELGDIINSSLAETLDISALSTSQLESLTAGIDIEAMQALDTELNNIALAMKTGTDTAEDAARATEILSNTEFAYYKDFSEAIDLLSVSVVDNTGIMLEAQRRVDTAMLSSLSYMNEVEKLNYANNIYQNAITQEDRVSSSRTIAELSRGQTRTREDYVPIFAQYLNELQKQGEEATLTDVVDELVKVNENIIESTDSATGDATYA